MEWLTQLAREFKIRILPFVDPELLDLVANLVGLTVTLLSFIGMLIGFLYSLYRLIRYLVQYFFGAPRKTPHEMITDLMGRYDKELDPVEREGHLALIAKLIDRAERDRDRRFLEALEEVQRMHPAVAEDILQRIAEEKAAEHEKAAKQAAEAYQMIGAFAYFHDTNRALDAYEKAVRLNPYDPQPSIRLGRLLIRIAQYDRAREVFDHLDHYAVFTKDEGLKAEAYRNLARIERKQGRLEEARAYHAKSLEIAKKTNDQKGMAQDYNLLGKLYSWQVDKDLSVSFWLNVDQARYLDQAEAMHRECMKLSEQRKDDVGLAFAYGGLGIVELQRGSYETAMDLETAKDARPKSKQREHYDRAMAFLQQSIELHRQVNHRVGVGQSKAALAHVHLQLGELDVAENLFFDCLAVNDETGDKESWAKNQRMLGRVALAKGDPETACERWAISDIKFAELQLPHWIERTERLREKANCLEHETQGEREAEVV